MDKDNKTISQLANILKEKPNYSTGELLNVVDNILEKKESIVNCVNKHKTPFYIYDEEELDRSIDVFLDSFDKYVGDFKGYYALKLNHHPFIIQRVVERGLGLEVASRREIDLALDAGCTDILYFAPGKTEEDLLYAISHSNVVTVNMDSFHEIKTLGELAASQSKKVRVGIRIHTDLSGDWKKYGIHIRDLKKAWDEAMSHPYLAVEGIHFHMSRNKDASFYEQTIKDVAAYLKANFTEIERSQFTYIDFGGGFEMHKTEGFFPKTTSRGLLLRAAHKDVEFDDPYYILESMNIDEYAQKIGSVIDEYLRPLVQVTYYSEPGRIICNNAMHIVLSIVDVKDFKNVILDGGVNMVGWQRFEFEYFPLINITNPAKKELVCNMWGNLCTTWDIWGYRCYAESLCGGDVIVVPNQGALTYSLAQTFIQPIPPVYKLKDY